MPAQEIDRYRSLARLGRSDITIMKSRFLGYAGAALTEEEARAFIARVRDENPGGSCVLYGYVCGLSGQIQRYDDAHEPSGGLPILEALKRPGLAGAVCAVVRYWGGVKLGASNLGRAFGQAAILAVQDARPCLYEKSLRLLLEFDYPLLGKLQHYLEHAPYRLEDTSFGGTVTMTLLIQAQALEEFTHAIQDLTHARAEILPVETCYAGWEAPETEED